jgi:serine/threonine protein kinase/Tfp pilus assembly protein PilF
VSTISTNSASARRRAASPDEEALVARLAEEMTEAWRQGACPRAEQYLDRYPALWDLPAAIMDLVYEEICLRREHGAAVDRQELIERFPRWTAEIEVLLSCAGVLEGPASTGLARGGEWVGDFRLLSEIGRGGSGRVFVATQASLGHRPVVVKISRCQGDEHLCLARLQHTHIVPLLSVYDDPDQAQRVLCMPYFGGLSLAEVLVQLAGGPNSSHTEERRTGRRIRELLDIARVEAPVALTCGRNPAAQFLDNASYVQAVAWMGACLAEALDYAHARGLVHLDLKPANVLVTADCQPMLLDFHLAREPLLPGDCSNRFGGTPAYMSPEQKRAMTALQNGEAISDTIDGRSDIYSLGMVLYEALGGTRANADASTVRAKCAGSEGSGQAPSRARPLHRCHSGVAIGLSDIVAKCLSQDARDRYQEARSLADDLWRHLNDRPLRGVPNRSIRERWRKWRRRKPHLLPLLGMLVALLMATGGALALMLDECYQRADDARAALDNGQKMLHKGHFADAASVFESGLSQLGSLPTNGDLKRRLTRQVRVAKRAQAARALHEIADRIRFYYGVELMPAPGGKRELEALEATCHDFWDKRHLILEELAGDFEPEIEQRIRVDVLDLAILWTSLRVRLAEAEQIVAARREALRLLDQAESLFGPNAVLYHERAVHAAALQRADLVRDARRGESEHPPRAAWEHYAIGRSLLQADRLADAAGHFEQALAIEPNGLWPNFYEGVCCYRLNRFDSAAMAFTVCTTLAPTMPACFHNRALAFIGLGQGDRAKQDFDRALQLDPTFADAAFNRGLLHFQENHLAPAAADLQCALHHGAQPARAHYQLALVCLAQHDRAGALAHLKQTRKIDPQHAEAGKLIEKLTKP